MKKNHGEKFGALYSLTDNEDALEIAQAELLAESFLQQAEDPHLPLKQGLDPNSLDKSGIRTDVNTTQQDEDLKQQRQKGMTNPV